MKHILIITVTFFSFLSSYAQYPEFAPVGATWYYNEFQINGDLITRKIKSINDTVRYNKTCKLLTSESSGDFFSYRDSLKIYVSALDDNEWYLLYDFNKLPGDTFYAHVWALWADSIPVKVIQKGDTIIGGYTLPYILAQSLDPIWPWNGKAILNIGSDVYFVPPYPIADPITQGLRCYEDTIIGNYHLVDNCDTSYAIGIPNTVFSDGIKVYPNPFDDYLVISGNTGIHLNMCLYDLFGRRVLSSFNSIAEEILLINTSSLEPGNYILKVDQHLVSNYFKLLKL